MPLPPEPALPPAGDRITVRLAEGDGGASIQVSVRGGAVRARIVTPDAEAGQAIAARVGELEGSLARQGFREAQVQVQAPTGAAGADAAGWATRAAAGGDAGTETGRDGGNASHRQDPQSRDLARPDERQRDPRGRRPPRDPREEAR